jgi:hypothetical protein
MKRTNAVEFSTHGARFLHRSRLVLLLQMFLLLLLTGSVLADDLDARISKTHAEAIRTIANYVTAGNDRAGRIMQAMNFKHPPPPQFDSFPPLRKIEAGYLRAEATLPKNGGNFLALLSMDLARLYEAVRGEPDLQPYLSLGPELSADAKAKLWPMDISGLTQVQPAINEPHVKDAILTLAKYLEGNGFGGVQGILRNYFGLSKQQTYEILRNSLDQFQALERGFALIAEPRRNEKMTYLVGDLDRVYPQARKEISLDPFRPGKLPSVPAKISDTPAPVKSYNGEFPPSRWQQEPPFGNGGVGGGGNMPKPPPHNPSEQHMKQWYNDFDKYSEGQLKRQSSLFIRPPGGGSASPGGGSVKSWNTGIRFRVGYGGVFFGRPLPKSNGNLGKLISMHWLPSLDEENRPRDGRLLLRFELMKAGKVTLVERSFGPVLEEDIYIARRIINGSDFPWREGNGIGLVGITNGLKTPKGRRYDVVLHPSLINTSLGWSALHVDTLPLYDGSKRMIQALEDKQAQTAYNNWRTTYGKFFDTYKISEAPLILKPEGGLLVVERAHGGAERKQRSALLDIHGYNKNYDDVVFSEQERKRAQEEKDTLAKHFRECLPYLIMASQDYERINRFAGVLTLMRWAKKQNVVLKAEELKLLKEEESKPPWKVETPGAVIIASDRLLVPEDRLPKEIALRGKVPLPTSSIPTLIDLERGIRIDTARPSIFYNGAPLEFDVAPRTDGEGIAVAPIRALLERSGMKVGWHPEQGRSVTGTGSENTLRIYIGQEMAVVNDQQHSLEVLPFIVDGRTLVPLSFFKEALAARIKYERGTGRIYIEVPVGKP